MPDSSLHLHPTRVLLLVPMLAAVVGGCSCDLNDHYVYNSEARQRAVCEPQSRVARTVAQGYRGDAGELAVYCADGRWAILYEGYSGEIGQPEIVRGR